MSTAPDPADHQPAAPTPEQWAFVAQALGERTPRSVGGRRP